uniref:Uncharacterized protein n=1 Tax=viral metagenome TaxID=1070528 RepID=A0A6C0KJA8_9ZZZZ
MILFSLMVVIMSHYGWDYIKQNYSTPITKNVIEIHTNKYKAIVEEILENQTQNLNDDPLFLTDGDKTLLENDLAEYMNSITPVSA